MDHQLGHRHPCGRFLTEALSPVSAHVAPHLSVDGFEGPLDFLLEMARRQRVDLAPLSILTLTDQLVAAIEAGEG